MARYYCRSAYRFAVGDKIVGVTAKVGDFWLLETKDKEVIKAVEANPEFGRAIFDADKHDQENKPSKVKAAQILKELNADAELKAEVLAGLS